MLIKQVITGNSDKLLVFFNGWSMDERVVSHLSSKNYDIVTVQDYFDIENTRELSDIIANYSNYSVIAWSLGVWCFSEIAEKLPVPEYSIAINGTMLPINDDFGISDSVYQATIDNLSEVAKKKFDRRMFTSISEYQRFNLEPPNRPIDNQKLELISIKGRYKSKINTINPYKAAIISNNDKIFTTQNQINYWSNLLKPIIIDSGHFPYYNYNNWDEILDMAGKNV